MSTISNQEFQHIATLAKLSFNDEEAAAMNAKFEEILNMFAQLQEVDVENATIMTSGIDIQNVMREDEPVKGMDRDLLFKNAKSEADGFIEVPATYDESEDA